MNTSQIKNFAIQSRNVLKAGVLNRIIALGFDVDGNLTVDRPIKIQGGTVFMGQLREEGFFDAWTALEERIAKHSVKEVCEEAAYTWFNRLVAIRIMQKNGFVEPVMQYASEVTRIPVIVDQARSGRLSLRMTAAEQEKLEDLLRDPTRTNEQFNLLISAYCTANPVIYNCFGGIEKHIGLLLPDNILSQGGFIDMLNNTPYLTDEDYAQSELIGWLYQYYIAERKDEVFDGFKKGKKAEAEDIPAATQIFTPNWIVKYMVENTVGRIYLDNNPYADDIKAGMKYLVEPAEPTPEDAILKIDDLTEYKMIDAACGSGHILIEGFNLFYRMYLSEGYAPRTAIENIFRKNIIGLDLDTRAKQLATFALLMTAAKLDKSFLDCKVMPRVLDFPDPFVYRGGLMKEFLAHYFLGGNKTIIEETEKAFELMKQADSLGSIMKFDISPETRAAIERSTSEWEKHEFVNPDIEAAIPSMKVILALTDKYTVAAMNPPYMRSSNMNVTLSQYVKEVYEDGKADLMTVFMLVAINCVKNNGLWAMINLPSWMFISSFKSLRLNLLLNQHIESLLHLGRGIFGSDFGSVAFVIKSSLLNIPGVYRRLFTEHVQVRSVEQIERLFLDNAWGYIQARQNEFQRIPNCPIAYWISSRFLDLFNEDCLRSKTFSPGLNKTANNDLYLRFIWEVSSIDVGMGKRWIPSTKGGIFRRWYGNLDYVNDWSEDSVSEIKQSASGSIINEEYLGLEGITWSSVTAGRCSFRYLPQGYTFNNGGLTLHSYDDCKYYIGLLNSVVFSYFNEFTNPTVNLNNSNVQDFPYLERDRKALVDIIEQSIFISKQDWDAHETSWDFKKNELIRAKSLCCQNGADMDMLSKEEIEELKNTTPCEDRRIDHCIRAYKSDWERRFRQLHANEEELNRQFIEIYGLQDELTPNVPLDEITILQQGEVSIVDNDIVWHDDVIVKQFVSYAIGCWMGRYRLDKEGLNIAHYPTDEEICTYEYDGQSFEIDDDAIIPLMGRDNPFEDDNALQKTVNFVGIVFGEENLTENLNTIEHCLGKSVEDYLVKDFWKDHKKMYQNRPIYWLFSSKKGAFQVLVYMHRMNPYTVEKIRTKYLLPYIEYLKGRIEADEARGADLTTVERKNLAKMQAALAECTEYHDRLHDVAIKAIDFDLDDGVVVNYAKFGDVVAKLK